MTPKEIRAYYNTHCKIQRDKVFDIETDGETFAIIYTVTPNHCIYKNRYQIAGDKLHYIGVKLLY